MTTTISCPGQGGAAAHVYTSADLERIAKSLGGARRGSDGSYTCRCPAHDDSNPSLSLSLSKDGRLLWHCHGPCTQEAVSDALKGRGLLADGSGGIISYNSARHVAPTPRGNGSA